MGLKPYVTSLDDLPEGMGDHYKEMERDGETIYVLDVDSQDGWALENVHGLKSAYEKQLKKGRELEQKLRKFRDIDPEKAREALDKYEEFTSWDPDKQVAEKIAAREKKLVETHQSELTSRDEKISKLERGLRSYLIEGKATEAILKANGRPRRPLLMEITSKMRPVELDDGTYGIELVESDGSPMISRKPGTTDPMTVEELVELVRGDQDFAPFFEVTRASGSGSTGEGGSTQRVGSRTVKSSDQQAMNENWEKIATGEIRVVEG